MTKAELIAQIAFNANFTKVTAERFVQIFMMVLQNALIHEGKVMLMDFGCFTVGTRKERRGHNPHTGEIITIKASRVVRFRPGKHLLELCQKN